jgi:tetratricopeptide (TPR) repeat protein
MLLSALALFAAQATSALSLAEQGRLQACLDQARRDPASAIVSANAWLGEASGAGLALPQQCLGQAYVSLLRWDAAEAAFLAARDASADDGLRARLGAMAGNAALAAERWNAALAALGTAQVDAAAAGDPALAGSIAADRSRAMVALDQLEAAELTLERARADAPQNAEVWLLSATLARRQGDLAAAAALIATAGALAPDDPRVALEAGVVAVLAGDEEAARGNWELVQELAPASPEAATAAGYLAQLAESGE